MLEIISRSEARSRGLKRFFTGKPCINGHVCEHYTGGGNCVECHCKTQRAYSATLEGVATAKRHRDKNGPSGGTYNSERSRNTLLKRCYGISHDQYEAALAAQGYQCGICGAVYTTDEPRYWPVDHCHETGNNRSILCHLCNVSLGGFSDDPSTLISAALYIAHHQGNMELVNSILSISSIKPQGPLWLALAKTLSDTV
jgi:hypothetical protein